MIQDPSEGLLNYSEDKHRSLQVQQGIYSLSIIFMYILLVDMTGSHEGQKPFYLCCLHDPLNVTIKHILLHPKSKKHMGHELLLVCPLLPRIPHRTAGAKRVLLVLEPGVFHLSPFSTRSYYIVCWITFSCNLVQLSVYEKCKLPAMDINHLQALSKQMCNLYTVSKSQFNNFEVPKPSLYPPPTL